MSYITLNPIPGIYSGSTIGVSGTVSSDVKSIIYTTDGTAPTLAKYIAYDNLTPKNPFVAVVQDGKGNVVFDGGFPKFYNGSFNAAWTTYAALNNTFKYFANTLDFIVDPAKVAAGNKKILFLGDVTTASAYPIKSTGTYGFYTSITKICNIAGYTPVLMDPSDFAGGIIDLSYSALDQYAGVVFFSTFYDSIRVLSANIVANLVALREAGTGMFIITDHGDSPDSVTYPKGFYYNANLLASNFGARFSGNFDRTPVNVGYLIDNYGNHPLWKNMDRTSEFYAGGSESKITVTIRTEYPTVQPVTISTNGYSTIRYLIQMQDGSIKLENYTYGLNVPEIFEFRDGKNVSLGPSKRTILNNINLNLYMRLDDFATAAGIIKHNSNVIGEFSKSSLGLVTYRYYSNNGNRLIKNGDTFTLQLNTPVFYSKNVNLQRVVPNYSSVSLSKQYQETNSQEFRHVKNMQLSSGLPNIFKSMFRRAGPSLSKQQYLKVFRKYTSDVMNWDSTIYRDDVFDVFEQSRFTVSTATLLANEITTSSGVTITKVENAIGGTVSLVNGATVNFDVTATVGSPASFTYEFTDANGLVSYGFVQLNVKPKPPIVTMADTIDVIQGSSVSISQAQLLANDATVNAPLSFVSAFSPLGGNVSVSGSNLTFTSTGLTGFPAGFTYQCKDSKNNQALGEVIVNVLRLPAINAYVFNTTAELDTFKAMFVPATMSQIFTSWGRFAGNVAYPSGTTPGGEAASWSYDSVNDAIKCTVNSSGITGFTSLDKLDIYESTVKVSSADADNDCIMFVIAFDVVGGNVRALVALRTGSSDNTAFPSLASWGLYLYSGETATYTPIQLNANAAWTIASNGWSSRFTHIKVTRNKNSITCFTTPFGSTTYDPNSKIEIDTSSIPSLSWIGNNKLSYGYACHSQNNSTYGNLTLVGGSDTSKLYDVSNNTVWIYNNGWSIKPGATLQTELGYPRTITNPDTGITYEILESSIIVK